MRTLVSYHFITLDGVVETPDQFWRNDLFDDFSELTSLGISGQDAVLLGRNQYEDWYAFWSKSEIEPFSTFINNVPKFVVSHTLNEVPWNRSTLIRGDLQQEIAKLKSQPGQAIGLHGSISLTQSLLAAGLVDEVRLAQLPVIAGSGRRLLEHAGPPLQMDLQKSLTMRSGLQYLVYTPRKTI
jgi:dihydrofolate reductase